MRALLLAVDDLGRTYGYMKPQTTTFGDAGSIGPDRPLRAAYAHKLPTTFGWLAASMRLLRVPEVVYTLGQALNARHGERTLAAHLMGVYGVNLAAVYGDRATLRSIMAMMDRVHARRFPADEQPNWLVDARDKREEFTPGNSDFRLAVTAILTSGAAKAHGACGLIDGRKDYLGELVRKDYLDDLAQTVFYTTVGNAQPNSIQQLQNMARQPHGVRLMDRDQIVAAGVPELLGGILNTELAPGVSISTFAAYIKGFMQPGDQEVLGLEPTQQEADLFDAWLETYRREHELPQDGQTHDRRSRVLDPLWFFPVAKRGA